MVLNNWKTVLNWLIGLGLIVLIFVANPFNIFGSRLKVRNTANLVTNIREIGQLVTAEYYGEVVSSYKDAMLKLTDTAFVEFSSIRRYSELRREIFDRLAQRKLQVTPPPVKKKRKWWKISIKRIFQSKKKKQEDDYLDAVTTDVYANFYGKSESGLLDLDDVLFCYLNKYEFDEKYEVNKIQKDKRNARKQVIRIIRKEVEIINARLNSVDQPNHSERKLAFDELRKEIVFSTFNCERKDGQVCGILWLNGQWIATDKRNDATLTGQDSLYLNWKWKQITLPSGTRYTQRFSTFYYEFFDTYRRKVFKKIKLGILGRGRVKAGFDFGNLDERNLVYDEGRQTIHVFNATPKLLDVDINPWFIPERGVPGFEIFMSEGDVDFETVREVKLRCIEKLEKVARSSGILKSAEVNGKEVLSGFFNLVLNDEVKEVVFHPEKIYFYPETILSDDVIDDEEVAAIDSLVNHSLFLISQEKDSLVRRRREALLRDFLSEMNGQKLYSDKVDLSGLTFNYYTKSASSILEDGEIDQNELDDLLNTRWDYVDIDHETVDYLTPKGFMSYYFTSPYDYLTDYNDFVHDILERTGYQYYNRQGSTYQEVFQLYPIRNGVHIDSLITADRLMGYHVPQKPFKECLAITDFALSASGQVMTSMVFDNTYFDCGSSDTLHLTALSLVLDTLKIGKQVSLRVADKNGVVTQQEVSDYPFILSYGDSIRATIFHRDTLKSMFSTRGGKRQVEFYFTSDSIELSRKDLEIMVLRNHIIHEQMDYAAVGPIVRARRRFDKFLGRNDGVTGSFQNARSAVDKWAEGIRKKMN